MFFLLISGESLKCTKWRFWNIFCSKKFKRIKQRLCIRVKNKEGLEIKIIFEETPSCALVLGDTNVHIILRLYYTCGFCSHPTSTSFKKERIKWLQTHTRLSSQMRLLLSGFCVEYTRIFFVPLFIIMICNNMFFSYSLVI